MQKNSNALTHICFISTRIFFRSQFRKQGSITMRARGMALEFPPWHILSIPHTAPSPSLLNTGAFPKLLQREVDQSPSHKAVHVQTGNPKPVGNEEEVLGLWSGTHGAQVNAIALYWQRSQAWLCTRLLQRLRHAPSQ